MKITPKRIGNTLHLGLSGSLDITTAVVLENEFKLEGIDLLTVDLGECDYISSAGLRSLMSAHKTMASGNRKMVLTRVSKEVYGVLELTGLSKLMTIEQKIREVSLDGLPLLSVGVCGECYRLDQERIVKLYHEGVGQDIAEREKEYSKAAFVLGIPTAISYELVRCGTRTGIIYEMLDAELFSTVIRNDLENIDAHAQVLAAIANSIHSTQADSTVFPVMKDRFRDYIAQMDFFLSKKEIAFLEAKLESIPDSDTCVHFDMHSSNIMIRRGEPLMIDMGDLSRGSYLFDIGLLYMIYGVPELGICELATKIPSRAGVDLWERFIKHYFAGKKPEEYEFFHQNRYFFASLRVIYVITFLPKLKDDCVRWMKEILIPKMMIAA